MDLYARTLCTTPIQWYAFTKANGTGNYLYSSPVLIHAFVEENVVLLRGDSSDEVVQGMVLHIPAEEGVVPKPQDKFRLPDGRECLVQAVTPYRTDTGAIAQYEVLV